MNNTRQTNTFSGGMNMDLDYSLLTDKQYLYAENIRILTNAGSSFGAIQNIEGFEECETNGILNNEIIIHTAAIRDWCILFTQTVGKDLYSIYVFDFTNSKAYPNTRTVIKDQPLNIRKNEDGFYSLSSVCQWESDDNVKLYYTDGVNELKVLYIDAAHSYETVNPGSISITPTAILPPLQFAGFGQGSLKSGAIQYCYQLFNVRGTASVLSQLTNLIYLTDTSGGDYVSSIGSQQDVNTNKSVKLTLNGYSSGFDRVRIISIYYKTKHATPIISIVDDIPVSGLDITYEDKGNQVVSELSIDEFNALTGYLFTSKVIASKDNRLFAGNITEHTWDVDYDARAYRCEPSGYVNICDKTGAVISFEITDKDEMANVPKEFDCINVYNFQDSSAHKYTVNEEGNYIQGGKGLNISYRFVNTELLEDESTLTDGKANEDFCHNVRKRNLSNLTLHYEKSSTVQSISLSPNSRIPNYQDPEIASKVTGYTRDEVYRFGIVLYNEQGVASPVHWIGDIRMPSAQDAGYETFVSGGNSDYGTNLSVVTKPLGIEFTVENLPEEVKRYEIVRCERTAADRTVVSQGVVSNITAYDGKDSSTLTPFPYLSYANKHGYYAYTIKDGSTDVYKYSFNLSSTQCQDTFMFVTPDVCVNRDNATSLVNAYKQVKAIGYLDSVINHSDIWGTTTNKAKPFANARAIKDGTTLSIDQVRGKAYGLNGTISNDGWIMNYAFTEAFSKKSLWYTAFLSKYYNLNVLPGRKEAQIQYARYSGPADVYTETNGFPWYNTPGVQVGDKVFYNWVWDNIKTVSNEGDVDKTDANNVRKYGPHGVCVVFKSDDLKQNIPNATVTENYSNTTAVLLCNMTQSVIPYGGNSYSAIQNSVYIPTGTSANRDQTKVICFGGDTYINMFDYNNSMFHYYADDYTKDKQNRFYHGAFIPVESSINLSLTHDSTSLNRTYQPGTGYANHYVEDDIVTIGGIYSQGTPSYAYNDAYSAQPTAKRFVSKSIYNVDNLHTDTRVMVSEMKTNNEVLDSWSRFKVANYLDVDTQYGGITDFILFHNRLFFWQTDAFGVISSNERSLITDNNPGALTLGTGDILARYDYLTTINGKKINQLRADTQSDDVIYWYDSKRNELCTYNGNSYLSRGGNNPSVVSKLKGIQSYLNNNEAKLSKDPITVYDKKYTEVLFTLESKTLVYNESLSAFTSFYTFVPDHYGAFSDKLYVFKKLKIYKYNSGEDKELIDTPKESKIIFIVNANYPISKTFDNVEYSGDFTKNTNFKDIFFETKRQSTDKLSSNEIDYREDTYKFCIPRNNIELNAAEELVNKSYKDRMKGKYMICHYTYDCSKGNTFKVPYISTAYRQSLI